jgi:ribosome recycling factor
VAHKYAEEARIAVRHVRRDRPRSLQEAGKGRQLSEDDGKRHSAEVQKVTDQTVAEVESVVAAKEKEIMQV